MGTSHPDLAMSFNNIDLLYMNIDEYTKALQIQQESLVANHPDVALSYDNIGVTYVKMDDFSKALPYFERAVSIGQCSLPPNHPQLRNYNEVLESLKEL